MKDERETKSLRSTDKGRGKQKQALTRIIITFVNLITLLICTPAWCVEHPGEAVVAEKLIRDVINPSLIDAGVCSNLKQCRDLEFVLYSVGVNSINIELYRVDSSKKVEDFVSKISYEAIRLPYKMKYVISIFNEKHEQKIFGKPSPFIIINIERNK